MIRAIYRTFTLVALLPLLAACTAAPTRPEAAIEAERVSPTLAPTLAPAVAPTKDAALFSPAAGSRAPLPITTVARENTPALLDLTVAPADLWQRVRNGFAMIDLHSPLVVERQSWYLNRPEMLQKIFDRGSRYLFHIVEELEKRGMPTELALLPMVESAYNPQAISSARAAGMWQFIPSTGRNYNLAQNWWVDERRDIVASTEAALSYLQNIYEMHGDWHLALASYNWGENAVARAIARNAAQGLPTDYASLTMPEETRYYVPKLQALKNIVAHPEYFNFRLAPISNRPYFESVTKPERIDVAVAARLADMTIDEFISLNPAYHRPVMNAHQAGPLLLPVDRVDTFLSNLARHAAENRPLSNWQTHQMKRSDTLASVAARFGITETRLRQINGITPRVRVQPGFALLVPRPGSDVNPDKLARILPKEAPAKAVKKKTATKKTVKPAKKKTVKPAAKNKPQAKK